MVDPMTYYLNQHLKEEDNYISWIESHEDFILERYCELLEENNDLIDEIVFEGVLDDDYPDTVTAYLEGLTFEDVPDDFISDCYNNYSEGYDD